MVAVITLVPLPHLNGTCRVMYSGMLEKDPYPSGGGSHQGTTADYLFMLIFGGAIMLVSTLRH